MATDNEFNIDEIKLDSSLSQKELDDVRGRIKQVLANKETEMKSYATTIRTLRKKVEELQNELEKERQEKQTLQQLNEQYIQKLKQSFTSDELADYLNQAIATFNDNASSDMTHAKYIVNNLDVDLKAQLYTDELGNLRFSAPFQEGTAETMSSIKISISAIPNT